MGGQELRTLKGLAGPASSPCFSPDGIWLAAGSSDGTIGVWRVADGVLQHLYQTGQEVTGLAFSPDGSLLAAGEENGSIELWDSSSGALLTTLVGHTTWVAGVAFSPDGLRLLSTSADGTLRLWGISPGQP